MEAKHQRDFLYSSNSNEKSFKNRRAIQTVELRKNKRADDTFTKRNIKPECSNLTIPQYDLILFNLQSSDISSKLLGISELEQSLCTTPSNEYINICIDPIIESFTISENNLNLQASSLIANISNTDYSFLLSKWIPTLICLIPITNPKVQENIYWILGNIALDSEKNRSQLLQSNIIDLSLEIIKQSSALTIAKKICWFISNCCKDKDSENSFKAIPILSSALSMNLIEIFPEVLWALSNISEKYREELIKTNVLIIVMKLCKIDLIKFQQPSFRIIGNMLNGTNEQVNYMIQNGALRALSNGLESRAKTVKVEVLWGLSNLCAGKHVSPIINKGIFKKIIDIAVTDCVDVQKEAVWSLFYAVLCCDTLDLEELVKEGLLSAICYLLATMDSNSKMLLLKSLEKVLKKGEESMPNPYVSLLEDNGGKETIESLTESHNKKINARSSMILNHYFDRASPDMEIIPTKTYAF